MVIVPPAKLLPLALNDHLHKTLYTLTERGFELDQSNLQVNRLNLDIDRLNLQAEASKLEPN
jgi:hypothetical protein